jgi:hypothetical protein
LNGLNCLNVLNGIKGSNRSSRSNSSNRFRNTRQSSQRVRDFSREAKIKDALGRRQLLWFDALSGDGDHFALKLVIDGA